MSQLPNGAVVPFVVDSPLPNVANGAAPPEPAPQNTPDPTLQKILDASKQQQQAPKVDPETDRLGKLFNVDLSQFSNPNDAKAAVRLVAERYAALGSAAQQQPQQQIPQQQFQQPKPAAQLPAAQQQQAAYDGIDPVIAQKLQALEAEVQAARQESQAYKEQAEQQYTVQLQAQEQQLHQRAQSAIDKLASPKYGVGGQQTFQQRFARENLIRMTMSMANGMYQSGTALPTIEEILQSTAEMFDGYTPKPQAAPQVDIVAQLNAAAQQQVPAPFQAPQVPAPQVPAPFQVPQPQTQLPPNKKFSGGINDLSTDSTFMAGARQILSRGR